MPLAGDREGTENLGLEKTLVGRVLAKLVGGRS